MPQHLRHKIQNWIFDLDNTIYPATSGIQHQVDERMPHYIMRQFGLDYTAARKIQKDFYYRYGTTLSGLVQEHKIDPWHYWDYIFDIDYAALKHDLALREVLAMLPGRKFIFTNSPHTHAQKVLDNLGIAGLFAGVFDLTAADLISKPDPAPYAKMLAQFSINPHAALFIDDVARNLVPAHQLGVTTVYLARPIHAADDAMHGVDSEISPYVDYQTDDMLGFLQQIMT
jgi:putative hydrolase of the HAD superfamily